MVQEDVVSSCMARFDAGMTSIKELDRLPIFTLYGRNIFDGKGVSGTRHNLSVKRPYFNVSPQHMIHNREDI